MFGPFHHSNIWSLEFQAAYVEDEQLLDPK